MSILIFEFIGFVLEKLEFAFHGMHKSLIQSNSWRCHGWCSRSHVYDSTHLIFHKLLSAKLRKISIMRRFNAQTRITWRLNSSKAFSRHNGITLSIFYNCTFFVDVWYQFLIYFSWKWATCIAQLHFVVFFNWCELFVIWRTWEQ